MTVRDRHDEMAIRSLILSQFASLNWSPDREADWLTFEGGFLPETQLFPAARPVQAKSVKNFRSRLEQLRAAGNLSSFAEQSGPIWVRAIGGVAVAIAGCEMVENEETLMRDVSCFLLVKDGNSWKIAAQGWDLVEDFAKLAGLPEDT